MKIGLLALALLVTASAARADIAMLDPGGAAALVEVWFQSSPDPTLGEWDKGDHGPSAVWPQGVLAESLAIEPSTGFKHWSLAHMTWDTQKDIFMVAITEPQSPFTPRSRGSAEVTAWWNFYVEPGAAEWLAYTPNAGDTTMSLHDLTANTVVNGSTSNLFINLLPTHTYRLDARSAADGHNGAADLQLTFSTPPEPIPAPGAVVLGLIGVAGVGALRRRLSRSR